jgi:hypothetical protein
MGLIKPEFKVIQCPLSRWDVSNWCWWLEETISAETRYVSISEPNMLLFLSNNKTLFLNLKKYKKI